MLSGIVEKRINEISIIADELSHILPRDGWSDYAVNLLAKLQRLAVVLDDEEDGAEDRLDEMLSGFHEDDEEKTGGGHGNTRLPYGLCKREGIEIDPNWTPRDAWAALEKKGYNVSNAYKELEETGEVSNGGVKGNRVLTGRIYNALKSEPNKAIFFSGCSRTDENGMRKKSPEVAKEFAENNDGVTLGMLLEKDGSVLEEWNARDFDGLSQWEDASRAYAEQASGSVRVIAKKPLRKDSIFNMIELPTLKENPNVTSVTMINADTGEEEVIFRR